MKTMRRWAAFLLAAVLSLSLAGCAGGDDGASGTGSGKKTVTLKVWGAQEDQALLQQMVDGFKKANTDKEYKISLGVVGEKDAKAKFLEDPAAAADIFSFPNDQINPLVGAGALYEITRNKTAIQEANSSGSVESAMVGDKLYGYPMTADNGYFLYYDKSVISAEQAKSLDEILKAANAKNKKVYMDVSNGWYTASFFLGAGGKVGLDDKGKQTCDFNNETGVKVGEAIKAFCADKAFITGEDAILTGGMGTTIAAGVSGTWNAEAIKDKLGDNYAATKLPTFTMDGKQVQMGSFAGYKLLGINQQTKHPVEAMALAEWLTNEQNQIKRFKERAMGPSNTKAAASEEVQANVALAALSAQSEFATSQKNVLDTLWPPLEAFGTAMENKDYSKSIKQQLDAMVEQITK